MAKANSTARRQRQELIDYLRTRQSTLLTRWHNQYAQDQELTNKSSLLSGDFDAHLAAILTLLAQYLADEADPSSAFNLGTEFGMHRWQHSYSVAELLTELDYLHEILLDELTVYEQGHPGVGADALLAIHRLIDTLWSQVTRGSVLYYDRLRQASAAKQASHMQLAMDELQHFNTQRNQHLRHSSHDLLSSFGVLAGAASLLELPRTKKERTELVAMLNRNLTSLQAMLGQLTDFARLEAGQETLALNWVDVAAVLQEVMHNTQPLAQERKLNLQSEGPPSLWVSSDAVKLQRILQNLLHNALKYTHAGGVYVSWQQESDTHWTLSVRDTGPGFPADSSTAWLADQLRPLDPADPGQLATHAAEQPTRPLDSRVQKRDGLGLFIVKMLCELLRASVGIDSLAGRGTLIRIRFPIHQTAADRATHPNLTLAPNPAHPNPGQRLRILIAGGSPEDQALLIDRLQTSRPEPQILDTISAGQTLSYLRSVTVAPQLLLLTLSNPRANWHLLQDLHSRYPQLLLIVISPDQNPDTVSQIYALGAYAFIGRPLDDDAWRQKLDHLILYWHRLVGPGVLPAG